MTTPSEVPRLRRDPAPDQANSRRVIIGVFVFFVLLVAFVVTLVVTIGLHNNGVKIAPGPPATSTSAPIPGS